MRRRPILWVGVAVAALALVLLIRLWDAEREYQRRLAVGERALSGSQANDAAEAFSAALSIRPSSMVARYRRGEAYSSLGRFDEAAADLLEARRLAPGSREPLEALGRLADLRGRPAEAAEWYAEADARLAVPDSRLRYLLGRARYRAGQPAGAVDPLRSAIARDPAMAEAHFLLGVSLRDAGHTEDAVTALEQAVRVSRTGVDAHVELADLLRQLGRPAEEVALRRALAAIDPTADRHVDVALANLRAGRPVDAQVALAQAASLDAGSIRVALARGRVHLFEAERFDDPAAARRALDYLERAIEGPGVRRSEGLSLYGRALFVAGRYAEAERYLEDAVLTSPVETEAFDFLADAAERLGHTMIARDALLKLAALEGDTAPAARRLARARRIGALSLRAGDPATAIDYLNTAIRSGQSDAGTLGLAAEAEWRAGDRTRARVLLEQALAQDGQDAALRRLARQMRE